MCHTHCTSARETLPTATTAAGGERSCDKSHDSSKSDNEIFSTLLQTPVNDDSVLVSLLATLLYYSNVIVSYNTMQLVN